MGDFYSSKQHKLLWSTEISKHRHFKILLAVRLFEDFVWFNQNKICTWTVHSLPFTGQAGTGIGGSDDQLGFYFHEENTGNNLRQQDLLHICSTWSTMMLWSRDSQKPLNSTCFVCLLHPEPRSIPWVFSTPYCNTSGFLWVILILIYWSDSSQINFLVFFFDLTRDLKAVMIPTKETVTFLGRVKEETAVP